MKQPEIGMKQIEKLQHQKKKKNYAKHLNIDFNFK